MSFAPVVQLRFGRPKRPTAQTKSKQNKEESFITTIPPNHLAEFTFESVRGVDRVTITFLDHTFGNVEQQILKADRDYKGDFSFRWGYPGNGLEQQQWFGMKILDYVPTIDHTGLRITLSGLALGAEHGSFVEPRVYYGKISSVVRQIAKEMEFEDTQIFIEETNDDNREVKDGKKAEWPTGSMSRNDLLNKLVVEAKSKANPHGTYDFRLSANNTFHFCTQFYKKRDQEVHGSPEPEKEKKTEQNTTKKGKAYRRFEVLFGQPTKGVIRFAPRYNSKALGAFASTCIAGIYDPRTKQHRQINIDRNKEGMTSSKDPKEGGRTTLAPYTKSKDKLKQREKASTFTSRSAKQTAIGGSCSGQQVHDHRNPEMAENEITSAWRRMHNSLMKGSTLELEGLPENADLLVDEVFIEIAVILPHDAQPLRGTPRLGIAEGTNQGIHWSSGRYQLDRVTHSITTGYKINVELLRPVMLDGPDPAKTGKPKITPAVLTSTAG